jgi:hypothetical protein
MIWVSLTVERGLCAIGAYRTGTDMDFVRQGYPALSEQRARRGIAAKMTLARTRSLSSASKPMLAQGAQWGLLAKLPVLIGDRG